MIREVDVKNGGPTGAMGPAAIELSPRSRLEQETNRIVTDCGTEIDAILQKYGCMLEPVLVIGRRGVESATVRVVVKGA